MKRSIILILIFTALITGCAIGPMFQVNVDSISTLEAEVQKKYILLSGLKDVKPTDLQFREYASYVDKALAAKGFVKADDFQDANVAIFLAYGIGNPQKHHYTYSLPVWGQTGVSSSTTSGTLSTYGGYGTYRGTTTYTPTYGITGYTSHSGTRITYFRFLVLDAVDLNEYRRSQNTKQIWRTTVTSTGSSGDLRRVFPVLVGASRPYIGINTGKKIKITLTESDKRVIEIKGIK